MLGKITEGLFLDCGLYKAEENGAMYILTESGKKVYLNRKNIEGLANLPAADGAKQIQVTWINGQTSVIRLGSFPAAPEEAPEEEPAVAEEPAYVEPVAEAPAAEEPEYEQPAAEAPVYEEPVYEEPVYEEPMYVEPEEEVPAPAEPAVVEEPAVEEPAAEEPAAEEPPVKKQTRLASVAEHFGPGKTAAPAQEEEKPPLQKLRNFPKKKVLRIALLVLGVLSLILGLVAFGMETGYYENSVSYGGDAYTGIQNAAAQTANNLIYLAEIVRFGFGSLLTVLGGTMVVSAVCMEDREKH